MVLRQIKKVAYRLLMAKPEYVSGIMLSITMPPHTQKIKQATENIDTVFRSLYRILNGPLQRHSSH